MTWVCPSCGQEWPEKPLLDGTIGCPECGSIATEKVRRECLCEICDREYAVWFAPSDLWNAVMREGDRANPCRYAFVCPSCFSLEAEARGIRPTAWVLTEEDTDLPARLSASEQELAREVRMHQERVGALNLEVSRRLAAEARAEAAERVLKLIRDGRCGCGGRFKWKGYQLRCEQCDSHSSPVPQHIVRVARAALAGREDLHATLNSAEPDVASTGKEARRRSNVPGRDTEGEDFDV